MRRKNQEFITNIKALYFSMACVFFSMAVFRILTVGAEAHEWTHLIISSVYLFIGIIMIITKK